MGLHHIPTLSEVMVVSQSRGALSRAPESWPGLVALWTMTAGGGYTAFDASGFGNDGILTNMNPATEWVVGSQGMALDFDGDNDYVDCGNIQTDVAALTLAVLVQFRDVTWPPPTAGRCLVRKGYDGSTLPLSLMGLNEVLEFGFYNGNWDNVVQYAQTNFSIGVWYLIVGTISATDMILYVNGRLVASFGGAPDPLVTNNKSLLLGAYDNNGTLMNEHDGQMALAALWFRALSASEIKKLYNDLTGMYSLRSVSVAVKAPVVGVTVPLMEYHYRRMRCA